jgi:DNA uptake protein ComE-like DNA-binding protein
MLAAFAQVPLSSRAGETGHIQEKGMQQGTSMNLVAVIALALALAATVALAGEGKPQAPTSQAKAADKTAKAAKPKAERMVDINRATKAELAKLPDMDEKLAEKIIAGRPYRTKAELVTRNVIPGGTYESLKRRIIAKPK